MLIDADWMLRAAYRMLLAACNLMALSGSRLQLHEGRQDRAAEHQLREPRCRLAVR